MIPRRRYIKEEIIRDERSFGNYVTLAQVKAMKGVIRKKKGLNKNSDTLKQLHRKMQTIHHKLI